MECSLECGNAYTSVLKIDAFIFIYTHVGQTLKDSGCMRSQQ